MVFDKNIESLKRYKHAHGWDTVGGRDAGDQIKSDFRAYERTDKISLLSNIMNREFLVKIDNETLLFDNLPNKKIPIYLYFSRENFDFFLHNHDISPLLVKERIVFLVGQDTLESYFEDMQTLLPQEVFGYDHTNIQSIMDTIAAGRQEKLREVIQEVNDFYKANEDTIHKNIVSGNPKILLIKYRFSYAVKNHIRDCNDALRGLGYDTFVSEEKSDISRIYRIIDINEYKPDIIIDVNYFRYTYSYQMPPGIVYVTWIQDYMPHTLDAGLTAKLGRNDYVMNHYIGDKRFAEAGYSQDRMIDAPVCANPRLYKTYYMSSEEKQAYQADLCMVCQQVDLEGFIDNKMDALLETTSARDAIRQFLSDYCEDFRQNEKIDRKKAAFLNRMNEYLKQRKQYSIPIEVLEHFVNQTFVGFHERLYRQALADWIIEAGYTNIKLWGAEWAGLDKYRPYAMGQAENGEVLSKILQSSKIVIGNNFFSSALARAWESMLSGAFYMSNYVSEDEDLVDIRKVMQEDREIIIFHGKSDFLDKVNFYLSHEEERRRMIEIGRKKALATMTFDATMKKVMDFIVKDQKGYIDGQL